MIDRVTRDRMPDEVVDLAARLIVAKEARPDVVTLRQKGRMRQGYGSAWMPFTAHQTILCADTAFAWKAKMGPLGAVYVTDAYQGETGELSVKLFGLFTMVRPAVSEDLNRGELLRYLAEIAWAPHIILQNDRLSWKVIAHNHFEVSASAGDVQAKIELFLNAEGQVGSVLAQSRPRAWKGSYVDMMWRGEFSDYHLHDGIWTPFSGRVGWHDDRTTEWCWEGEITEWAAHSV
ncbi:DUF6544 family protein [Ponticaulis koreensis]|uniref:DUF6544 family protein n=1 Tax=Ponticaulis koreensis TaxID=1123045 RepID=UPI0003B75A96|nr:DUF6544 family protein [Ponticaulis koreensis]